MPPAAGPTNLAALAPARQAAYAFLRAAFAEAPRPEWLAALRAGELLKAAGRLFSAATLASLQRYAESAPEPQRQARQEFMNLFKVPGGQYVAPYESVFRETRAVAGRKVGGLLLGRCAVDVQKWYRLAALEIAAEYKDLPDHVCLELDYLARLCAKEQEFARLGEQARLRRARQMQRDFLAGHLARWIAALRDRIHAKTRHAYFRALADLATEFVERDLATLEGAIGKSSGQSAPSYQGPA